MNILIYFHGGDLPGWLINLLFILFYLAPAAIIFSLGFIIYKLVHKAENKIESQNDQDKG